MVHSLSFEESNQRFELVSETIDHETQDKVSGLRYGYHRDYENGTARLQCNGATNEQHLIRNIRSDASIVSQLKDPERYPQLNALDAAYGGIRIYRNWAFGRLTSLRTPQPADQRNDYPLEDMENLGMVLSNLRRSAAVKQTILDRLKNFLPGLDDYEVIVEGGTVQLYFQESGFTIPATRLSDGTLRYLCLLVILCHPEPPPLICIEEPELGMHPDIVPTIARLLKEASERTQLMVTTHSDILIDELSDEPESVVVCEKHDGQTMMKRLGADALNVWLEKYRLGELWLKGEIGGTRW
jgi:predicted ATPase